MAHGSMAEKTDHMGLAGLAHFWGQGNLDEEGSCRGLSVGLHGVVSEVREWVPPLGLLSQLGHLSSYWSWAPRPHG